MTQKKENDLMNYMLHKNYKVLCDEIKVQVLETLINLSLKKPKGKECVTINELIIIQQGINELRGKEKADEVKDLASVINNLVERGNGKVPTDERKVKKK